MAYKSIIVEKGSGGFGGPLTIVPTEQKHKVLYIVGGGQKPAIVDKICSLTGMEAVNGFKTKCPDDEVAVAIVDCGGTLRCGLYPKMGIPTINVVPTGKAGPMAEFITESIYVSNVGVDQIRLADETDTVAKTDDDKIGETQDTANGDDDQFVAKDENATDSTDSATSDTKKKMVMIRPKK